MIWFSGGIRGRDGGEEILIVVFRERGFLYGFCCRSFHGEETGSEKLPVELRFLTEYF